MGAVNSTTQIFEILESTLESINNILDVAVKNKIDARKIIKLEKILKSTNSIIAETDNILKRLEKFDKLKINFKSLKTNVEQTGNTIKAIVVFSNTISKMSIDPKINEKLDTIKAVIENISVITIAISSINVVKTMLVLPGIMLMSMGIFSLISVLGIISTVVLPLIPIMSVVFKELIGIFNGLTQIITAINTVKPGKAYIKLIFMQFVIKKLMKIVVDLSFFDNYDLKGIIKNLGSISLIARIFANISEDLSKLKINALILFKLRNILKTIRLLYKITNKIARMPRISAKALLSILTLSFILKQLVTVYTNIFILGLLSIPVLIGMPFVILSLSGLRIICSIIKKLRLGASELISTLALIPITLALIIVATNLALISMFSTAIQFESLLLFTASLVVMVGILLIFGKFDNQIIQASVSIILFSVCCVLLTVAALSIIVVSHLAMSISLVGIGILTLVLIGLTLVFVLLGKFNSDIILGAIGLIAISAALLIFAIPLFLLTKILPELEFSDIGKLPLVIAGLALAFGVAGLFVMPILLGAAAIAAIAAALTLLVAPFMLFIKTIQTVKNLKITEEEVKLPIRMMGALVNSINEVFGLDALVTIPLATAKVMALIPVALAISAMAETLQEISSLNMPIEWDNKGKPTKFVKMEPKNFKDAAINACNIAKIMANVFGEKPVELTILGEKITLNPITQKELEGITFSSRIKMRNLSKITESISDMAETLRNIASLNMPIEFNNAGKPIKFKAMESKDFVEAATNALSIAKLLANLFGEDTITLTVKGAQVQLNPITKQELEGITLRNRIKMNNLAKITDSIGEMAYVIQQIASLNMPSEWNKEGKAINFRKMEPKDFTIATQNVVTIVTTLIGAITNPALSTRIEDMSRKSIKKVAEILNAIGSLNGLVNAIQQMVQMNVPTAFDKKGQPIAFKTITLQEREAAIENVKLLMTEFLSAITDPKLSEKLEEMDGDAAENFQRVMSACTGASELVDTIKKAASFDKKTIAEGIVNIKEAILRYTGVINDLFVDKLDWARKTEKMFGFSISIPYYTVVDKSEVNMGKIDGALRKMESISRTITPIKNLIDSISEVSSSDAAAKAQAGVDVIKGVVINYAQIFTGDENGKGGINISETGKKKFAAFQEIVKYQDYFAKIQTKNLAANTDQFVKLIDKTNSIDTTKITTVRDMFKQMAEFSKSINGNFDKLADVISEKLIEALEKLAEIFDKANNANKQNVNNTMSQTNTQTQTEKANESISSIKNIEGILDEISSLVSAIKRNTSKDSFFDY